MSAIRPRRSVLYMPGANERALEKAKTLPADSLILDLEDAVAPEAKVEARDRVCNVVKAGGYGPRELIIRINGQDTEWGRADMRAAVQAKPDAILAPKVATAEDIRWLDEQIRFDRDWESKVVGSILKKLSTLLGQSFDTVQSLNRYRKMLNAGAVAPAGATAPV